MFFNKKDKILQYGERIWGIKSGTDNEKIDKAITKTIEFFESVGIKTTLPDYGVPAETINIIMARFEKRGNKLGENADIDFNEVGEILRNRL